MGTSVLDLEVCNQRTRTLDISERYLLYLYCFSLQSIKNLKIIINEFEPEVKLHPDIEKMY